MSVENNCDYKFVAKDKVLESRREQNQESRFLGVPCKTMPFWHHWAGLQSVSFWNEDHEYGYDDDATTSQRCAATNAKESCILLQPKCAWKAGRCIPSRLQGKWAPSRNAIANSVVTGEPYTVTEVVEDGPFTVMVLRGSLTRFVVMLFPSFTYGDIGSDTNKARTDRMAAKCAEVGERIQRTPGVERLLLCGHSMGAVLAQKTHLLMARFAPRPNALFACGSGAYLWATEAEATEYKYLVGTNSAFFVNIDDEITWTIGTGHTDKARPIGNVYALSANQDQGPVNIVDKILKRRQTAEKFDAKTDEETDEDADVDARDDPHDWRVYAARLSAVTR